MHPQINASILATTRKLPTSIGFIYICIFNFFSKLEQSNIDIIPLPVPCCFSQPHKKSRIPKEIVLGTETGNGTKTKKGVVACTKCKSFPDLAV